jgi:hypothetical protein
MVPSSVLGPQRNASITLTSLYTFRTPIWQFTWQLTWRMRWRVTWRMMTDASESLEQP